MTFLLVIYVWANVSTTGLRSTSEIGSAVTVRSALCRNFLLVLSGVVGLHPFSLVRPEALLLEQVLHKVRESGYFCVSFVTDGQSRCCSKGSGYCWRNASS
eukprot:3942815-Amphidinium_carterae.1